MKIYIINRNLLTWPAAMADVLSRQGHRVIFVDNASEYPPLLEYYAHTHHEILHVGHNAEQKAPWLVIGEQHEPYVVTDPDLDISHIPDDWPEVLLDGLVQCGVKCGFALQADLLPKASCVYNVSDVLQPNHAASADTCQGPKCKFQQYAIDTTFAVYEPNINVYRIGGMRACAPYEARHLPWHVVPKYDPTDPAFQIPIDEEYTYYIRHATRASSMMTFPYVQDMVRRR